MEVYIESEMYNAIFHDPKFVGHYLSGNQEKSEAVDEYCPENNRHYRERGEWELPNTITNESCLYQPILDILDTIK
jgi:hypothetical protein